MKNFAKRISALVLAVVVSAAVLCPAAFAAQLPSLPKDQCVVDGAGVLSSSTVQTITELNAAAGIQLQRRADRCTDSRIHRQ